MAKLNWNWINESVFDLKKKVDGRVIELRFYNERYWVLIDGNHRLGTTSYKEAKAEYNTLINGGSDE